MECKKATHGFLVQMQKRNTVHLPVLVPTLFGFKDFCTSFVYHSLIRFFSTVTIFMTYTVVNPMFHARTKHITFNIYHFVRECVAFGSHKVKFISSVNQLVDVFTQRLPTDHFERLVSKLVYFPAPILPGEGGC